MAPSTACTTPSLLDPTAPSFKMPAQPKIPESAEPVIAPVKDGQTRPSTQPEPNEVYLTNAAQGTSDLAPTVAVPPGEGEDGGEKNQLSNEKRKLRQKAEKKAEKQAKRAAQKASKDPQGLEQAQQQQQQHYPQHHSGDQRRPSNTTGAQPGLGVKTSDMATPRKRAAASSDRSLPMRPSAASAAKNKEVEAEMQPVGEKKVAMFSHLYSKDKRATVAGVGREIHPAVLTLGIQLRDLVICGGNARCVATLLAFKKVIQSYITPPSVALPRHLTTHLSHQISYLSSCRPLSISQGNSIRWLKKLVVELDPKVSDPDARDFLCRSIDLFIREKVTLADEVIAREASEKITNGDVVLVYAKSSVVEKSLLAAHRDGKNFCVVVADSRPLFEGKNLARSLVRAGLQVQYCLLSGLGCLSKKVTKCFLGASGMMGNGRLYSRAGTALVAMIVKDIGCMVPGFAAMVSVPVIVLCESVKFSSRVLLDSIVGNELGDAEALVEHEDNRVITSAVPSNQPAAANTKKGKNGKADGEDEPDSASKMKPGLGGRAEQPNLQLLHLMYDVTPAEYLDIVITELGSIPPAAVSAVNGVWGGEA